MTTREVKSAAGVAIEVDAIRMPGATTGQVPVCDSNGNMVAAAAPAGDVTSPQPNNVTWEGQQSFPAGIDTGATIPMPIPGCVLLAPDTGVVRQVGTGGGATGRGVIVPDSNGVEVGDNADSVTTLKGAAVAVRNQLTVGTGLAVDVTATPSAGQVIAQKITVANGPSGPTRDAVAPLDDNGVGFGLGSFDRSQFGVNGHALVSLVSQGMAQMLGAFGGDPAKPLVASGTTYAVTKYDFVVACDPSTSGITIDLSGVVAGGPYSPTTRMVLAVDVTRAAATHNIVIDGDTINGVTNITIATNGGAVLLISGGAGHGWLAFALPVA